MLVYNLQNEDFYSDLSNGTLIPLSSQTDITKFANLDFKDGLFALKKLNSLLSCKFLYGHSEGGSNEGSKTCTLYLNYDYSVVYVNQTIYILYGDSNPLIYDIYSLDLISSSDGFSLSIYVKPFTEGVDTFNNRDLVTITSKSSHILQYDAGYLFDKVPKKLLSNPSYLRRIVTRNDFKASIGACVLERRLANA